MVLNYYTQESKGNRGSTRFYASRIAHWLQADPLAEKYLNWRPYNYVLNNPMSFVDPEGMEVKSSEQKYLQNTADRLNEIFKGANITVISSESEEGMFVLATDLASQFVWSQNDITRALFDVIHSADVSFEVKFADNYFGTSSVGQGSPMGGMGGWGGAKIDTRTGCGDIWIAKDESKINSKNYGIVFMHEAIGHGHPNRGNDARKNEKTFLGYELGKKHGRYRSNIGWTNTNLLREVEEDGFLIC